MKFHIIIFLLLLWGATPSYCQDINPNLILSNAEQLFNSGNIIQSEVELNIGANNICRSNSESLVGRYYSLRSFIYFKTERYNNVIDYAPKAIKLLKNKKNQRKEYIQSLYSLAASYYEVDRLDDACSTYLELINEYKICEFEKEWISNICCELGYVYEELQDTTSAIKSYELGQELSNELDCSKSETYNNLYGLCSIYSNNKEYNLAIKAIEIFINDHNEKQLALAPLEYQKLIGYKANLLYNAKDYENAEAIYYKLYTALKNDVNAIPEDFYYLYNQILLCCAHQGKISKINEFLPLAKNDMKSKNSYINLLDEIATTFFEEKNYKSSINYYLARLKLNPNDNNISIIRFLLGRAFFSEKRYDEALEQLKIVRQNVIEGKTEGFNNIIGLYATLDMIYFMKGEYLKSYKMLTEAENYIIDGNFNDKISIMTKKANSLRLYGDNDKALETINNCLVLVNNKKNIDDGIKIQAIMQKAVIYHGKKEYTKAIDIYNQCLEIDQSYDISNISILYHNIGKCYMELKDYNIALKNLNKSIEFQKRLHKLNPRTVSYIETCKSHIK